MTKLTSNYYKELFLIEPLTLETLILEINCNLTEITEETIREQFEKDLRKTVTDARYVFETNLVNIVKYAQEEREND